MKQTENEDPGQRREMANTVNGRATTAQLRVQLRRYDEQRRQQADGQVDKQAQQRPAKVQPEVGQGILGDHRV